MLVSFFSRPISSSVSSTGYSRFGSYKPCIIHIIRSSGQTYSPDLYAVVTEPALLGSMDWTFQESRELLILFILVSSAPSIEPVPQ